MSFRTLHKLVTFAIAAVGLYGLSFGGELAPPVLACVAVGVVAAFFAEAPFIERPGYTRFWNYAVVAVFILQVVRALLGASLLMLGAEYAAFLQVSRLAHRKSAAEHQQVAVLAFLHLIAATMLSTGLDYAAVFLSFVVLLPWMLALTHLRAEIETQYRNRDPERQARDTARVLASRRIAGPGFLFATASLAVPLFLTTAALFLLFPRVGLGMLSFGNDGGARVAGFGRNVRLGGFGVIWDDPTVVLRVLVPGLSDGRPRTFRLRGTSFDHYDGAEWTRSVTRSAPVPQSFDDFALVRWPRDGEDMRLRIILDPLDEPVLFLPEGTVALTMNPHVEGGREVVPALRRAPGLDIRYANAGSLHVRYVAHVSADPNDRVVGELTEEERARYLELPERSGRLRELASQLVSAAGTDAERVARLVRHLRDSGRYAYSRVQPDARGRDPLEVFLFEARAGHCEYFSTALALLLRAVGIPSRNVTGFLGGTYNEYGDYYALRQGDAHSWVEAHVDGVWRTLDPTPPARGDAFSSGHALESLRALIDAARVRWSRDVVAFDLRRQVEGFRAVMRWFRWVQAPSKADARRPDEDRLVGSALSPWLWAIPIALAGIALVWIVARRRRARKLEASPSIQSALALYRELERRLGACGFPRPPARTPSEHARLAESEHVPGADVVTEVTQAYLEARYGGRELPRQEAARLRARLRDLP